MLTTKITNIADSIRNKKGITKKLTLDEMPIEIESIETKSEPILQDKTIEITENGTTNIVADEGYDGLNNVEVVTNVASVDNINLFIQNEEPDIKNGIWLKTNSTDIKNANKINIIGKDIDVNLGEWDSQDNYEQLPYDFYLGSSVVIGTDIYIFFNETISGINALYKYDTIANTYTKLKDVPFDSNRSTASIIGTDIYIFGSTVSPNTQAYKYDTLTDTYTKLANTPYNTANASSVAYNNSIYIFGGSGGTTNAYRYDIVSNTYTKLKNMTYDLTVGKATIVEDTVYMFGLGSGFSHMQKYNIPTNTYNYLGQLTQGMSKTLPVSCGDYIFVIGSSYNNVACQTCYRFNTLDDTVVQLPDLPYQFGQGDGGLIGNKIYLIGSKYTGNTKRVQTVNVTIPEFEEDTIILSSTTNNQYNTKLSNSIECNFNNSYVYLKNKNILPSKSVPIYYGNNSSWIKIKG